MQFEKSHFNILFGKIIGFLFFLVLIGFANYLIPYFNNEIYTKVASFFNDNLLFLIILSVVSLIADIFLIFIFPFNLFAPILGAITGVMTAVFIFRTLLFADSLANIGLFPYIENFKYTIYLIVFGVVLIVGYINVFKSIVPDKEGLEENEQTVQKKNKPGVSWDEVGNEFKMALFNLGKTLKNSFDTKPKNKR
jgi:hypothetical protein